MNDPSLEPLLRHLAGGAPVTEPTAFPRGTLLPDGRLDLCKQALGAEGARAVAAALRGNRVVKSLLLGDDRLGNAGAAAVAGAVGDTDAITTVFVGCNLIDERGARSLASAVAGHASLRGLWLKRNPLGPGGARVVALAVERCPTLRALDLVQTGVGESLARLADAIARHPSLRRVYLSGNDLGPDDAPALARMLAPGSPVRALYLSANRLGDEGVMRLVPALAACRDLAILSLGSNGLSSDAVRRLAEALADHPSLDVLDVRRSPSAAVLGVQDNGVDGEALAALQARRAGRGRLVVAGPDEDVLAVRSVYRVAAGGRPGSVRSSVAVRELPPPPEGPGPTAEELAHCARVLVALRERPGLAASKDPACRAVRAEANRLVAAIQRATQTDRKTRGRTESAAARERRCEGDRALVEATGIRAARRGEAPSLPSPAPRLGKPRVCYVCKRRYDEVHRFYDAMCIACGDEGLDKRAQRAELAGRRAAVTGGRVKIGHLVALSLLRSGAEVIVTTRFPWDAARRFAQAPDFHDFAARLAVHGLDLRDLRAVERFTDALAGSHLDVLVNNAAQTVRRPPAFYEHLIAGERAGARGLPEAVAALVAPDSHHAVPAALLSQAPLLAGDASFDPALFPPGLFGRDGQQIDRRPANSWGLTLGQIDRVELLEVHHVNAFAPFLLVGGLLPLLRRSPHALRFVVNVSAMEGKFDYASKQPPHPHTNMAKAALNMLTRTAGPRLAEEGIYMTSVDTGWITDEHPLPRIEAMRSRRGFAPPLDEQDGAARVLDPVYAALGGAPPRHSVFLKDYRPASW
jgi:NAD(P)-dependent dehydrogenase (short-subunit alcohol dehydrogenase family)/Ran GTPase-activating protein (RanGAP) involved in mRNA processing and transport